MITLPFFSYSIQKSSLNIRSQWVLLLLVFCFGIQNVFASSGSVTLSGKTIRKTNVQVSCSWAAKTASKSRKIEIGRAYNSSDYYIIAKTSRRVTRLTVKTKLSSYGSYYFICRVTLKNGKVLWSNKLTATINQPTPKPTAQPTATPTEVPELRSCPSNYGSDVVALVSQARSSNGLSSLQDNSQLQSAAQGHTNWMAQAQNLTHGTTEEMVQRIRDAGFMGSTVGENIAWGQTNPSEVMEDWLNSPGHRANILDSRFHYIGVGCVLDRYGKYWWTQNFGS